MLIHGQYQQHIDNGHACEYQVSKADLAAGQKLHYAVYSKA